MYTNCAQLLANSNLKLIFYNCVVMSLCKFYLLACMCLFMLFFTCSIDSTDILWAQLPQYLATQHHKQKAVGGDGHCFLESIRLSLAANNIHMTLHEIIDQTEIQVYDNLAHYSESHIGNKRDFLRDVEKYLRGKQYEQDVTDVVIAATSDALHINLKIHQKVGTTMAIVNHTCSFGAARMTAKMVYTGNHYNPIVPISIAPSAQLSSEEDEDIEVVKIDQFSSHSEDDGECSDINDVSTTSLLQK